MKQSMEIIKGEDYIKFADLDLQLLEKIAPLEVVEAYRQRKITATRLKSIHADTREQFSVVLGGIGDHTAAFIDTASHEKYIGENTLLDEDFSLHAARHEQEHHLNGIFKLNLQLLNPAEHQILQQELNLTEELDETTLIEGFNELSTFQKHGRQEKSGYAQREVPIAEKLENLAQKHFKKSLLEIFRLGQAENFIILLKELVIRLQIQKTIGEFTSN